VQSSSARRDHAPLAARQSSTTNATDVLHTIASLGPLIPRLVATGALAAPLVTIMLQRDTFDISGNVGLLSLGELPSSVQEDRLTWVPLRTYSVAEGGLPAPTDSPNEVYPRNWEIFIDDVFLDGKKLPRSNLSSSSIALSALVDTVRPHSSLPSSLTHRTSFSTYVRETTGQLAYTRPQ
jgi:hypothetical protein